MLPVVLHHGLFGYDQIKLGRLSFRYFHKIDDAIRQMGREVIIPRVHPTASIRTRAAQLKEQVFQQLDEMGKGKERVILVAHSMGGLDARYMVSQLEAADRVAAVVTITSPHRGSPYADWFMKNFSDRTGILNMIEQLGLDVQAGKDLTTHGCEKFNDEIRNARGVKYFSISCAQKRRFMPPFAIHSHKIVFDVEGDNDGLVSTQSSDWGKRLGTWPISHWQAINKPFNIIGPKEDVSARYIKVLKEVDEAVG